MIHHLRAAGVSLIVDARGAAVPAVLHWGSDLGALAPDALGALAAASVPAVPPSSIDTPLRLSLVPTIGEGWSGRPGVQFARDPAAADGPLGADALRAPRFRLDADSVAAHSSTDAAGGTITFEVVDDDARVAVSSRLELTPEGVLRIRHRVANRGEGPLAVARLATILPVPARASELLDFSGLWARERRPIRRSLDHGVHARESRHGRGGHDDAFLLVVGTPGFGFGHGEAWATHVAWSGDTEAWAERSALGAATLGGGELLAPGEVVLGPGEATTSPWVVAVHSTTGLDGLSDRLHPWIRSWSTIAGRPRPVTLNTWEAVYFDQSLERLEPLIDAARRVGVERFVLDDGWFLGRRDDRRALGDWTVDPSVWPDGLGPLIERVASAGMEFGLWVEPEMVSADSEVARAHPDWVLGRPGDPEWRWQRVLDLTAPGAADHVFAALDALLAAHDIRYLKWDHNRDLLGGSAHAQTTALYALIDRLRAAHPGVEIESCASGGARIDLGILERTDRVWTSDTNDPLERQPIQRYTGVLVPPEYLGSHLGAERAHTTGRASDLSFRLATALFGSAGIEWNLATATDAELDAVAAWTATHRRLRSLLHGGRVVRADAADPAQVVHGVVAPDRRHAVVSIAVVGTPVAALPPAVRMPGLDPDAEYLVRRVDLGPVRTIQDTDPPWFADGAVRLPGRVLAEVGLPMPLLAPEQALVLELVADRVDRSARGADGDAPAAG
ncbi:alpha-galactosidase [Agromyces kandeliae]|uniref:Alpha-galactosidase n=1 Tax=Agromyces kandeliae TaxID=2666141 RepID=A0A6L5QY21_9MICO|nr:alpha-galactosidase [Agromyces kandeliae]MRX42204.1 alpha-galactosidase [Agromyces kandeliae]